MRTVLIMFVAAVAVLAGKVFLSTGISHGHPIPQETLFKMSPSEMCLREDTDVCVGLTAVPTWEPSIGQLCQLDQTAGLFSHGILRGGQE